MSELIPNTEGSLHYAQGRGHGRALELIFAPYVANYAAVNLLASLDPRGFILS